MASVTSRRSVRRMVLTAAGLAPVAMVLSSCNTTHEIAINCKGLGESVQTFDSVADTDVLEGNVVKADIDGGLLREDMPPQIIVEGGTITFAVPPQLATVDSVTAPGSTTSVQGGNIVVKFTGGAPLDEFDLPKVSIAGTVKAGTAGTQIVWSAYTKLELNVDLLDEKFTETCAPAEPGQPLNYTNIKAGAPIPTTTVTAPVTTTTTGMPGSTTTTTAPTGSTTTTTAPPASTTTTSLSVPVTTIPAPTTTVPPTTIPATTTTAHGAPGHGH